MPESIQATGRAYTARLDVYGLRVGVRTTIPGVLGELSDHLPVGWKTLASGRIDRWYTLRDRNAGLGESPPLYILEQDRLRLAESATLSGVWPIFAYDLELYLVERSPDYVFLHAGVVAWRGRAILVPGRSFSGKSTLVAALCQAGAAYYSDEYALLDGQGRVHAYPRPLRLRQALSDVSAPPEVETDRSSEREPLAVGTVVVTRYEPGAVWQPTPLSPGEAVLELLPHALSVQRQPQVVLAALRQALAHGRTVRGSRGEAKDTAERLLRWASAGGRRTPEGSIRGT